MTLDLVRTEVTQNGSSSTWADESEYGVSGNPLRNTGAVYLTAYKVDEDLVETALAVTAFDPEVATTFTTSNGSIDGWVKYYFVFVPNWLVGTTYEKYDLVWDTTLNAFYEFINDTPTAGIVVSNLTYWSPVTDPSAKIANVGTASESGNLSYQVVNKVLTYQTSICYIKAASKHSKETCGTDDCGCDSRLGKAFHKIRDLFNNLPLNESTGQFIEGEKNARLAEKYCDDCGCLTR